MTISNTLGVSKVLRAGLYERVSTTEQAMKGYSIETQKENLEEYCANNNIKIVDHYTDEGISGSKSPLKRPALKRLLEDVEAGKIDIVIFTKLDRWFRNVQEYFKVQEILDKHNVSWKTIFEEYNTDTADGRLKVNIMLSVAANERERTSERIKVVFDHKIKNKEAIFGNQFPRFGYLIKNDENGVKRLIKDSETEEAAIEFWEQLIKHNQVYPAARYMREKYGIIKQQASWDRIARSEIYTGEYRGVKGFCEPYVDREAWEKFIATRFKRTQKNRIYIFTGLIRCPSCGKSLNSFFTICKNYNREYNRYRCPLHTQGMCENKKTISEKKIEEYLLNNLEELIAIEIEKAEAEKSKPKPKPKTNINALKERLRRLNVMYMAGNKPDNEYLQEQAEIKSLIAKAEKEELPEERDLTPLKKVLETNILEIYETLTSEEKRCLWHGIIKEIKIEGTEIKDIIFL